MAKIKMVAYDSSNLACISTILLLFGAVQAFQIQHGTNKPYLPLLRSSRHRRQTFPCGQESQNKDRIFSTGSSSSESANDTTLTMTHMYRLTFPETTTYRTLMAMSPGDHVNSKTLTVNDTYDFQVKLYPQGGGQRPTSGFGMAYKVLPSFIQPEQNAKVGVYLQFLPRYVEQTVDAAFALRLKGKQAIGQPRFDVEWRAGMRFQAETNLKRGVANDFGAHLMQTSLLGEFLGVNGDTNNDATLDVEVEIKIFDPDNAPLNKNDKAKYPFWEDVRSNDLRVASVVVPVLRKLSERPKMMAQGVYPGVEYRILRMIDETDADVFYHKPGAIYEMKPIYPLVVPLERPWPVSVRETDIPKLVSSNAYNAVSALASLATAIFGLTFAFLLSTAISLFYIPSRSMEPTLQIGDVLLVEKVYMGEIRPKDIVMFQPPTALQDIVAANGGRLNPRDLFVKRVAGLPGDSYRVQPQSGAVEVNGENVQNQLCQAENGIAKFLKTETDNDSTGAAIVVPKDSVLVLGDCGNVSVDSRVWGPLPKTQLVGRPLIRVWPVDRMGPVR